MDINGNLQSELFAYVKENTYKETDSLTSDTKLFDEGIFDSMGFVLLLDFLEEKYHIIAEDKEDKNIILSQDEFKEHHGEPGILSILNISHEEYLRRQGYGSGLKVP